MSREYKLIYHLNEKISSFKSRVQSFLFYSLDYLAISISLWLSAKISNFYYTL